MSDKFYLLVTFFIGLSLGSAAKSEQITFNNVGLTFGQVSCNFNGSSSLYLSGKITNANETWDLDESVSISVKDCADLMAKIAYLQGRCGQNTETWLYGHFDLLETISRGRVARRTYQVLKVDVAYDGKTRSRCL